ncbi:MAG TPA: hypothetical protein VFV07_00600, partial [Rhizomicrobium sp.]|nr:hypothetical protein [Rhizomicrobium sp.]
MNVLLAGCAAVVLMAVAVPAVAAAAKGSSADAKFKALYTAEWKWREDQFAGGEDDVKEIVGGQRLARARHVFLVPEFEQLGIGRLHDRADHRDRLGAQFRLFV